MYSSSRILKNTRLLLLFLLCSHFSLSNAQSTYTIYELQSPASRNVYARGINDSGEIVGQLGAPTTPFEAVYWPSYTQLHSELVTPVTGISNATANLINNQGMIVGEYTQTSTKTGYWSDNLLPIVDFPANFSNATDINNAADPVVVGSYYPNALMWTSAGGVVDLGSNAQSAGAHGVNNMGVIVGKDTGNNGLFYYDPADPIGMRLHYPFPAGLYQVGSINDNNIIADSFSSGTLFRCQYYNIGTGGTVTFSPLQAKTGNAISCATRKINNNNAIIGTLTIDQPAERFGYLYFVNVGPMLFLDDLIQSGSGWSDLFPTDINVNNEIIGYGELNGFTRAFIMRPGINPGGPGVIGQLDFAGDFTHDSGFIDIEIGGTTAGTYDVVSVVNIAAFNGGQVSFSLINGFIPTEDFVIEFLTAASIVGANNLSYDFSHLSAVLGPDWVYSVTDTGNSLVLTAIYAPDVGTGGCHECHR